MENIAELAKNVRQSLIKDYDLFESDNLYGFCAIASANLYIALLDAGYKPILNIASLPDQYHVFVSVNDVIVDITASQFGLEPVVVQHKSNAIHKYWSEDYTCSDLQSLYTYLTSLNWVSDQLFERPVPWKT